MEEWRRVLDLQPGNQEAGDWLKECQLMIGDPKIAMLSITLCCRAERSRRDEQACGYVPGAGGRWLTWGIHILVKG